MIAAQILLVAVIATAVVAIATLIVVGQRPKDMKVRRKQFSIYVHWDDPNNARPLYVGMTERTGVDRDREHADEKIWWPDVTWTQRIHFPKGTRKPEVLAREKQLIHQLRPLFNREHNPSFDHGAWSRLKARLRTEEGETRRVRDRFQDFANGVRWRAEWVIRETLQAIAFVVILASIPLASMVFGGIVWVTAGVGAAVCVFVAVGPTVFRVIEQAVHGRPHRRLPSFPPAPDTTVEAPTRTTWGAPRRAQSS